MTLQHLLSNKPVLFDGATGTEYQRRGLPIGAAPEIWVMENPDAVKDVHRTYVAAGAQVIETCTFGATKRRLEASDVPYSVADVTRTAVALAKEAAAGKALVAGSVGPFGGILEPYGEVTVGEVEELFAEQMSVLVESGADIVLIETMISLSEAIVALRTAKSVGASTVGVTMTFEMTGSEPRTSFGESVQDAVKALTEEGAAFIGANCGAGFELMRIVATSFRAQSKIPLLIQTNAGIPSIENGLIVYPEQAASFGRFAKELADLGIDMIGGCCGTTPEHISVARNFVIK